MQQPKAVQSNPSKSRRRHHGLQLVALLTSLLKELKGPLKECSPNRVNAVLTPHDSAITATESNAFAMLMMRVRQKEDALSTSQLTVNLRSQIIHESYSINCVTPPVNLLCPQLPILYWRLMYTYL
jgi:hypothetical protein